MGVTKITQARLIKYRDTFQREVSKQDISVELTLTTTTTDGAFTDFTGDSTRNPNTYLVPCLYKRQFSTHERTKYGLSDDVTGVIYMAPKDLEKIVGKWRFSKQEVKVNLHDIDYLVESVVYNAPHFDTCISVEMRLKDPDKN